MAYSGKYKPKNPSKYLGDPTKITYRSLWERKCMLLFDDNPNVIRWGSEEICIPYFSPVDRKKHRYYPDFIVELKNKKGEIETVMIEVKPYKQTQVPPKPKRRTKTFENAAKTYLVNQAKWEAAANVCDKKGWRFQILTERDIYGKGK
jgi:hypothetical protein|tara:strand:+ start:306 stop:749 length:444 start_codon:yes stop_codon:yes gene_type:complete